MKETKKFRLTADKKAGGFTRTLITKMNLADNIMSHKQGHVESALLTFSIAKLTRILKGLES